MKKQSPIRIGFDLDGVIAQHPLGGLWIWLRKLKERVLKHAHYSTYYYPATFLEKWAWMIVDGAKRPFRDKHALFTSLAKDKKIQFYLVTGRFKFLASLTKKWLRKYDLDVCFDKVLINTKDINPIAFKAKTIKNHNLDFFIDDDLETISYLRKRTRAKLYWIVPPHKSKNENHDQRIENCQSLSEALKGIFNLLSENSF